MGFVQEGIEGEGALYLLQGFSREGVFEEGE